ncbi:hypothetical protein EVAR_58942_1 [Eumeta japonica]|uniref:Uncharacterized protein n=1 Tax=Eumeta variegata TaxID=151549 RepID=A0A4C1YEX4_EUMVA|nr:hypothetical protein EVAR_58942_1 [Eumeta japonica]
MVEEPLSTKMYISTQSITVASPTTSVDSELWRWFKAFAVMTSIPTRCGSDAAMTVITYLYDLTQCVWSPTRVPDAANDTPSLMDLLPTSHPYDYKVPIDSPFGSRGYCLIRSNLSHCYYKQFQRESGVFNAIANNSTGGSYRAVIDQWLTSSESNYKVLCSILATRETITEYLNQVKSQLLCCGGCVEPSVPPFFIVTATAVVSSLTRAGPLERETLSPSV